MIKKIFLAFIIPFAGLSAGAQYYYNDVVNNKQVMAELAVLKEKKIKGIKVTSLESTGEETEGFTCQKKINRDFTEVEVYTETKESYPNTFISYFDRPGLLQRTVDSSEAGATTTDYSYDASRKLVSVTSLKHFSDDDAGSSSEKHLYNYNAKGILQKMALVKNTRDTTVFLFEADDAGNIIIEKNEKTAELYYYYYDGSNRLTDVVHRYPSQTKLINESSFEYNEAGQVSKMVTAEKDGAYYYTWRYVYEDGLRMNERCYVRGSIMGSVEYKYK